jgi:hypothetical protein
MYGIAVILLETMMNPKAWAVMAPYQLTILPVAGHVESVISEIARIQMHEDGVQITEIAHRFKRSDFGHTGFVRLPLLVQYQCKPHNPISEGVLCEGARTG